MVARCDVYRHGEGSLLLGGGGQFFRLIAGMDFSKESSSNRLVAVIQIEAEVGGETKTNICIACSTSETRTIG
jgi:hypothetical protein